MYVGGGGQKSVEKSSSLGGGKGRWCGVGIGSWCCHVGWIQVRGAIGPYGVREKKEEESCNEIL